MGAQKVLQSVVNSEKGEEVNPGENSEGLPPLSIESDIHK